MIQSPYICRLLLRMLGMLLLVSCFKKPMRIENKQSDQVSIKRYKSGDALESAQSTIVSRGQHACYVNHEKLWCWGANDSYQLGPDSSKVSEAPIPMGMDSGPIQYYASSETSTCVWAKENLWCWGNGGHEPRRLNYKGTIKSLKGGSNHFCLLDEDHQIWCWGDNRHGQLGGGKGKAESHPIKIQASGVDSFLGVYPGYDHSCAVGTDTKVYCWGHNHSGQVGQGESDLYDRPQLVEGMSGIIDVGAGLNHSCALDLEGQVWCWGKNTYGQLGSVDASLSGVNQIGSLGVVKRLSVGASHSCALNDKKQIKCWGWNLFAQIGEQKSHVFEPELLFDGDEFIEVLASHYFTLALDENRMVKVKGLLYGISTTNGDNLLLLDP